MRSGLQKFWFQSCGLISSHLAASEQELNFKLTHWQWPQRECIGPSKRSLAGSYTISLNRVTNGVQHVVASCRCRAGLSRNYEIRMKPSIPTALNFGSGSLTQPLLRCTACEFHHQERSGPSPECPDTLLPRDGYPWEDKASYYER